MRKYLYIGAGGIIGALLRYLLREIQTEQYPGSIPFDTLIINVLGCFLLALILTVAFEIMEFSSDLRLGIATGLLGAFTTFSTLCKESAELIYQGYMFSAVLYLVISALIGFAATYGGVVLARKVVLIRIKDRKHQKTPTGKEEE